ncbi:PREDICTED: uncharacterized protein LOC109242565 [Nicotiana attenuata]|uniref:uncharacterized protein LOC109242565 n=1 Tax=Nicotiana attenuata TaxID=49451 RepID=UPI0009046F46|nr:PREDICTED: uncharacterized protein LOC109242565 [Nicotiana attenuata]
MDDMQEILFAGPYIINNRLIILKQWTTDFDFEKEFPTEIPLWIRFPKLPLNCWDVNSLSRIASSIGTPMYADECTAKQLRVSYARMLMVVDMTKPLKDEITVEDSNGRTFLQPINYDWKPKFRETCQVIGHNYKQEGRRQNQYGATMNDKSKPKKITQQWVTKEKGKTKQAEEEPTLEQEIIIQQLETIRVMEAGQGSGVTKMNMPVLHEDQTPKVMSKNQEVERISAEFNNINFPVLGSVPLRNGFQILSREENGAHTVPPDIGGVAAIVETRVKENKAGIITRNIATGWNSLYNYSSAKNGRIWVLWDTNNYQVVKLTETAQMMHCEITGSAYQTDCLVTIIYGFNTMEQRKGLWEDLKTLAQDS